MTKEYYSMEEAAQELGLNRATVYRWAETLGLKPTRFRNNRKTYLSGEAVERIREAREKPWLAGEKPVNPESPAA